MDIFFKKTKKLFKKSFSEIIRKDGVDDKILEAAFVAYAHKNFFIDFLFWRRIYISYKYIKNNNFRNILDFGTGSGIVPYLLSSNKENKITAVDIDYDPLNKIKKYIDFSNNISFVSNSSLLNNKYKRSFDVIVALDVLEHMENIDETIELFSNLLKKDGYILVSGPTENFLYQIGRRIAGRDFSGEYHVSNIYSIKKTFKKYGKVVTLARLYYPFTLFEIFIVRLKK